MIDKDIIMKCKMPKKMKAKELKEAKGELKREKAGVKHEKREIKRLKKK